MKGKNNPFYGKKHSKETKEKISASLLNIKRGPHSEEHKKKIGEAHKGRKNSAESKQRMRDGWIKRKQKLNTN